MGSTTTYLKYPSCTDQLITRIGEGVLLLMLALYSFTSGQLNPIFLTYFLQLICDLSTHIEYIRTFYHPPPQIARGGTLSCNFCDGIM